MCKANPLRGDIFMEIGLDFLYKVVYTLFILFILNVEHFLLF